MTPGASPLAATTRADAVLRQLELLVTRRLDGLLQGDFQGLVPGAGSESGDGRVYRPGDDVRRMDWNLTARTTVPHVRQTIIDRELETWLLVDGSASLDFGTADCEKRDLALFAAAAVGFLTARQGNRLGTMLATPTGTVTRPPRSGRAPLLARLHELAAYRAPEAPEAGSPPADLAAAMDALRRVARRRGLREPGAELRAPRLDLDAAARLGIHQHEQAHRGELQLPRVDHLDGEDVVERGEGPERTLPVARFEAQARAYRVLEHVLDRGFEMLLILNREGREALIEQVPATAVTLVEAARVIAV